MQVIAYGTLNAPCNDSEMIGLGGNADAGLPFGCPLRVGSRLVVAPPPCDGLLVET
jgi:hypothetical protein